MYNDLLQDDYDDDDNDLYNHRNDDDDHNYYVSAGGRLYLCARLNWCPAPPSCMVVFGI